MSEYTPPREVDDAPSLMQRHAENKNALAYLEEVIARKNERIAELERELEMNGAQMAGDSALIRGLKQENARLREAAESLLDSVRPRFDLQHNKIVPDLYLDKLREALEAGDE